MMIYVILLLYIYFLALSNSNRAFISPLKSRDSRLKILINEWSKILIQTGFKSSKETGIGICKASLIRNIQSEAKQ